MKDQTIGRSALKNGLVKLNQVHALKSDAYTIGATSALLPEKNIVIYMHKVL